MSDERKPLEPEPSLWLDKAGEATMRRHFEIMLENQHREYFGPFFLLGCLEVVCSLPRELTESLSRALAAAERRTFTRHSLVFASDDLRSALSREDAERARAEKAEGERNALTDRVANLERALELARRPQ